MYSRRVQFLRVLFEQQSGRGRRHASSGNVVPSLVSNAKSNLYDIDCSFNHVARRDIQRKRAQDTYISTNLMVQGKNIDENNARELDHHRIDANCSF
jgi:hypothetical protein